MRSNKQRRRANTLLNTVTYWLVLLLLAAGVVGSVVLVVRAGSMLAAIAGMIGAFVCCAIALSYGASMRDRKHAPSR